MNHQIAIFGLPAGLAITDRVCSLLNMQRSEILVNKFADGEVYVKPLVSVRNKKVILIQSLAYPVNDSLMTLLIAIDALKRASAYEINLVIPYYAYARQDRKNKGREPITAKLVADLLSTAGGNRMMCLDIHSKQIQGFFNFPVDPVNCYHPLLLKLINDYDLNNVCIVAPDYGGLMRCRQIAKLLSVPLAIIDKRRVVANEVIIENVLGDVLDKDCIFFDDMIDTGNTLCQGAQILKNKGAKSISAVATHGLFSKHASKLFTEAHNSGLIKNLYVTDSLPHVYDLDIPGLTVVSAAVMLADLIRSYITDEGSISNTIEEWTQKVVDAIQNK